MMANSSLIQWLVTFQLDGKAPIELDKDAYYHLADGYVCARILNQISPKYFTDNWLEGIKPVPPNGSWRLRVSNLKRILQKIYDYASDLQSSQFKPDAITPDVAVIAQNFDSDQISRLIQLILFCAINCEKKQVYIDIIRDLPTQVKQDIKEAIEELLVRDSSDLNQRLNPSQVGDESIYSENSHDTTFSSSKKYAQLSSPSRITANLNLNRRDSSHSASGDISRKSDLDTSGLITLDQGGENIELVKKRLSDALLAKEERAQACHNLEMRLTQLQMEKDQLLSENEKLITERTQNLSISKTKDSWRSPRIGQDVSDRHNSSVDQMSELASQSSHNLVLQQNKKLQNEIGRLKEELIRIETEKEEYRLKSNLLREDLDAITMKHDELRSKAEQAKRLQDELDEHRHMSERVTSYEAMVENLMKKNNEMKRELKDSIDLNTERIQKITRLEAENKQLSNEMSRIDIYRKQLQEAQMNLIAETHRADKAEVELIRLGEKYDSVRKENEKLYDTTHRMMKGNQSTLVKSKLSSDQLLSPGEDTNSDRDFTPVDLKDGRERNLYNDVIGAETLSSLSTPIIELKDKVARLECENDLLKSKLGAKRETDQSVLGGLLDAANSRCTKLEHENRQSRKKMMLLEGRLKDLMNSGVTPGCSVVKDTSSDNTLALISKVEDLQRLLFQKEQELMDSETKYKRNLQKAKDVIKTLNNNQSLNSSIHPSCASSSSLNMSSFDEVIQLKQQIKDREDRIIELEREFYEFKKLKEIHERLIISAFYGFTTPIQWRNADKRLERTTLTSPPNTASSSINIPKQSH